jgi:hypothetical protein
LDAPIEDNDYFSIGERWCNVDGLLKDNKEIKQLLNQFAEGRDSKFTFSVGNLKAQYIPNEDFVDNGSAFIIYSLVGTKWNHVVWVKDDLTVWNKVMPEIKSNAM